MKQTSRITSTYSADVMGVCSALFELGGMTIMHDASGCNSTYTTHDEPRWYDMDSMVYISALTEMEAIMGDDEKLLGDIEDAVRELHPKFVAIAGTPIPAMTGFDFEAAARVAEQRTGVPCMGFPTTGMHTYIYGASMAFTELARRFVANPARREAAGGAGCKLNVLGLTPLDFSVNGTDASICEWLRDSGFQIVSRWAMGSSLDDIATAAEADVNLVVSCSGLGAAEVMHERFGIPYVVGLPIGGNMKSLLADALAGHKEIEKCMMVDADLMNKDTEHRAVIIGEAVYSLSLAASIELETGLDTKVIAATECPADMLRYKDRKAEDEEDIIAELEGSPLVIADPLYRPICPEFARFIELPSEAFSGRLYREDIPDLVKNPEAVIGRI